MTAKQSPFGTVGQALVGTLREMRTVPSAPEQTAPAGEHWTFLWRTVLAACLTWQFLVLFLVVEGALIYFSVR